MPTGYTANIYDGTPESFEDFALHFARNMGAFIIQRDEDTNVPPRIVEAKADEHYVESLERHRDELAELRTMSPEEKAERAHEFYLMRVQSREETLEGNATMRARYQARIDEAEAWVVPEVLQSFKDAMVKHLHESMEFDCGDRASDHEPIEEQTPDEWYTFEVEQMERSVGYYEQQVARSLERNTERREYAIALYEALGVPLEVGINA